MSLRLGLFFGRNVQKLHQRTWHPVRSTAAGYSSRAGRELSTSSLESSRPSNNGRPLNRRLEVDLHELSVMQCLEDLTLIDVRQPAELHKQEQIPGSVNIPLGNLRGAFQLSEAEWQSRFNTNKPKKSDKAIIFYARGPIASSAAVEIAHKLGYKKSRHYVGGWEDYCSQNNMPVIKPQQSAAAGDYVDPIQEHYNYHYYNPDLHYL